MASMNYFLNSPLEQYFLSEYIHSYVHIALHLLPTSFHNIFYSI